MSKDTFYGVPDIITEEKSLQGIRFEYGGEALIAWIA
jgi:hypothetical protein